MEDFNDKPQWYKLHGKKTVPCTSLEEWAIEFEYSDRTVEKTDIDKVHISTVFLGLDHDMFGDVPILFETMVFYDGDASDADAKIFDRLNSRGIFGYFKRYSTWEQAEEGHKECVEIVAKMLINKLEEQ